MKFFAALAVLAAASSTALAQFSIITPSNAVQCQPLLLTWTGGVAPYFLSVLPGNQPTAAALVDLGQQNGTSVTWKVNVAAGTSIGLTLRDNNGNLAQSGAFPVNPSSDASCLSQPLSQSGATGAAPTPGPTSGGAAPSSGAPAPTSATTTPSTGGAGSSTSTHTTGSASGSPSPTTNAARSQAAVGVAGIVGAAVLALFA